MKLPNYERAIIAPEKLSRYLLNIEHKRGGQKARLLMQYGYRANKWQELEANIRRDHLTEDVAITQETEYGTRYEIHAPLQTPNGKPLRVTTIWQIDINKDAPRLITLFPDKVR